MSRLERTELFLGKEALEKLKNARVAVMGLGGVGGAAAEALLRAVSAIFFWSTAILWTKPT